MRAEVSVVLLCVILGSVFSTNCPDRWIAFEGSCYLIGHDTRYNFLEAEIFCRSKENGHLVHVDSMGESEFLKSEFRAYKNDSFWMGLSDMDAEGIWVWYDNGKPVTYANWFPGDPNSYMGEEDCAMFWEVANFEWVDAPCSIQIEPICEFEVSGGQVVG